MHAEPRRMEKGSCPHDSRSVNSPSLHPGQSDDVFPGGKSCALGLRFHIQELRSLKDMDILCIGYPIKHL